MAEERLHVLEERLRLLVVDDEAHVRSAIRRVVRKEPYEPFFAASAAEALEQCRAHHPDVIVCDHLMPQMTGLELLTQCRLLYPAMVPILLTGQAEMETVIAAINEGAIFRFVQKPWDDDDLRLVLHLAFERARTRRELAALQRQVQAQARQICELETALDRAAGVPGSGSSGRIERDGSGAIVLDGEEIASLARM